MRGLHTAPVICWRSVWRWGPAGQHRFSGRLVTYRLGLESSFSCSFWRHGAHHLLLSAVQVWGRGGLQEVWMVFFQTCNRTHSDHLPDVDSAECWGMVSCYWWCLLYLSTLDQNHWKRNCSLACQNYSSLPLHFAENHSLSLLSVKLVLVGMHISSQKLIYDVTVSVSSSR